jgi:uncharacterized membrane protein
VVSRLLRALPIALVLVVVPVTSATAAQKSFSLPEVLITAVVNPDRSMDVTEVVTYDFDGGPFSAGIKTFESNEAQIGDFTASDEQGPLDVIVPSESISGEWEWELRDQPTYDETVTFTLTYHVSDAVRVGSDVADLNWKFIGNDHPGIGRLSIDVLLPPGIPPSPTSPPDTDTTFLRGFAHGPTNGVVRVSDSRVLATVDDVPSRRFVEVRAVTPATVFGTPGTSQLLPSILEQEREILGVQDEEREKEDRKGLAWFLTPAFTAVGLLGTGLLWFVGGRERRSVQVFGKYWREPLEERPAVALANLNRGTVAAGPTFAGTLVDLAQRGYLKIVGEHEERFGPDKTVHRYLWAGKELGPDVVQYEKDLLEFVFRGGVETTSDELNSWARTNQRSAQRHLAEIKSGVKAEYDTLGYESKVNGLHLGLLFAVCAAVGIGSWILKAYTDNGFAWVGVGAAVALFAAGSFLLRNRTQAGTEAAAKARGLKEFLKDFSQLEDAPVGHLILWERYLVYAVALGVSADLIRGMEARVPQVTNDPRFGLWYVGVPGHRFDGFDRIETHGSSLVTASTPNKSGGGGGFGGGGSSGGGGGGGFGAR